MRKKVILVKSRNGIPKIRQNICGFLCNFLKSLALRNHPFKLLHWVILLSISFILPASTIRWQYSDSFMS